MDHTWRGRFSAIWKWKGKGCRPENSSGGTLRDIAGKGDRRGASATTTTVSRNGVVPGRLDCCPVPRDSDRHCSHCSLGRDAAFVRDRGQQHASTRIGRVRGPCRVSYLWNATKSLQSGQALAACNEAIGRAHHRRATNPPPRRQAAPGRGRHSTVAPRVASSARWSST